MAAESHSLILTLGQLLPDVGLPAAMAEIKITGMALDSRKITAGDIFIALAGENVNGNSFISAAIVNGASAVLVEADKDWHGTQWLGAVPVISVAQLAQNVSGIAARFYNDPSAQMRLTGVTGTNGKTTCSLLLGQIFAHLYGRAGVIGTLGSGLLDSTATAPVAQQIDGFQLTGLTTPDPIAVQCLLAQLLGQKANAIAMEVSSHSLVQARVAAVSFHCAIFTNLTQDHLDYHGDLVSYGKAKQKLLSASGLRYAIVNADDAWAKNLLTQMPTFVQGLSYSTNNASADIYAKKIELDVDGICADIVTPWGEGKLRSSLIGEFNLGNLLAVIAAACVQDLKLADVLAVIPQLHPAPGRMQPVLLEQSEQDVGVIVDYAHTPDALENTIQALLAHKPGRLWTVFGCGGDRDRTKRPLMGRIAERLSDYVIVTNDNPRSEDPAIIAADILRGMHNTHGCLVIADRAQAIDLAVQQAKPGDLILVAGKGHENYQIFAAQTLPFSDVKHARISLQRRLAKRDVQTLEAKA
jgi:UDP-N-acetylmuramoyl-L-alanyl-D-glutamate--2,6-diaminopimelate ligase